MKKKRIKKIMYYTSDTNIEKTKGIIAKSRIQIFAIGTSLIPFVEHNDANRALMGSNMQRQAVPILKKESPLICTGIENLIGHFNEHNSISRKTGLIKYSSRKKIIIHENIFIEEKKEIEKYNNNKFSKLFLKKKKTYLKHTNLKIYRKYIKKTYLLKGYRSTNQNSFLYETPLFKKNEWIKKNQILTDGASTIKGKLSLGKNILVAYMSYKGYNFEDAIVISEKLIKEDTFTSIHIKKYKTFLINNETGEVNVNMYIIILD